MYYEGSTVATALLLFTRLSTAGAFVSSQSLRKPTMDLDGRGTIVLDVDSILLAKEAATAQILKKTNPTKKKRASPKLAKERRRAFCQALHEQDGDTRSKPVLQSLERLAETYTLDARTSEFNDGDWVLETQPTFPGLLGYNEDGDALFTMGKLTYNMIYPTNVVCSVQKMTQHIHKLSEDPENICPETGKVLLPPYIPSSLQEELNKDPSELRSVRNDVHFTIEENGIQGVLQMDGFTIPNPHEKNRYSIWFTGGRCYALNPQRDGKKWRSVFGTDLPKFNKLEQVQLWMANLFMGAEPTKGMRQDGSLTYVMKKPIGGHQQAYQQVLYLDDKLRVTVGNKGTIVVVSRMDEKDVL